jgi:hypothetical protein
MNSTDFVPVRGRSAHGAVPFFLPLHFDLRSREAGYVAWNEMTYNGYRKFSADATITFDKQRP